MDSASSATEEAWSTEVALSEEYDIPPEEQHSVAEAAAIHSLTGLASLATRPIRQHGSQSASNEEDDVLPGVQYGAARSTAYEFSTRPVSFGTRVTGHNISPSIDMRKVQEASSRTDLHTFPSTYDVFGSYIITGQRQGFGEDLFNSARNEIVGHGIEPSIGHGMDPFVGRGINPFVNRGVQPLVGHDDDPFVDHANDLSVNRARDPFVSRGVELFVNHSLDPFISRVGNDPFAQLSDNGLSAGRGIGSSSDRASPASSTEFDDRVFIPGILTKDPTPVFGRKQSLRPQEEVPTISGETSGTDNIGLVCSSARRGNAEALSSNELALATPQESRRQHIMRFHGWLSPQSAGPSPTTTDLTQTTSRTTPEKESDAQALQIASQIRDYQEQNRQRYGGRPVQTFKPSRLVLESNVNNGRGGQPMITQGNQAMATQDGTVAQFRGRSNSQLPANPFVPESKNCAIWITRIPAEATYVDLLTAVRGGKVFACLINRPTGDFTTSAAKLVFFTRASAEAFLEREDFEGIYVLGRRIRASWNRILYPPHELVHQSRVILISGPAQWMSFDFFQKFFSGLFQYDLESRFEIACPRPGWKLHVWKFASLRAQAESAKMAIERELSGVFRVEFGPDPCALPWF